MIINPKDRFKMVVAVHLVLKQDDKFLLGKRQNTDWADEYFHLFGGHVEQNELVLKALIREGQEELGIQIDLSQTNLVHVRNILRPDHSRLHLYFIIQAWTGEVTIKEPELCSELQWFKINELPENTTVDSKQTLENIQRSMYYSEANQND